MWSYLYSFPLFRILLLEISLYAGLRLQIHAFDLTALLLAACVLLFPVLNRMLIELVLILISPVMFYRHPQLSVASIIPLLYLFCVIAAGKARLTFVHRQSLTGRIIIASREEPSTHRPVEPDQTGKASMQPVLNLKTNPAYNPAIVHQHQVIRAATPHLSHKRNFAPVLLILIIGFSIGLVWKPAALTGLSFTSDREQSYHSYLRTLSLPRQPNDSQTLSNGEYVHNTQSVASGPATPNSLLFQLITFQFFPEHAALVESITQLTDTFASPAPTE
ncbi:MAG TPA: hypothetical protein PKL83_04975 [bacterium]|nr:hypothetical protein [bacterium]